MSAAINIEVIEREIEQAGETIVVRVLRLGTEECLTYQQVAGMLGVGVDAIKQHVSRHGLTVTDCHGQTLDSMKGLHLVGSNVQMAKLVPRDTIKALVKLVGTPEAWAAYNQLWKDSEQLRSGALPDHIQQIVAELIERDNRRETEGANWAAELAAELKRTSLALRDVQSELAEQRIPLQQVKVLNAACENRITETCRDAKHGRASLRHAIKVRFGYVSPEDDCSKFYDIARKDLTRVLEFVSIWVPPTNNRRDGSVTPQEVDVASWPFVAEAKARLSALGLLTQPPKKIKRYLVEMDQVLRNYFFEPGKRTTADVLDISTNERKRACELLAEWCPGRGSMWARDVKAKEAVRAVYHR